MRNVPGVKVHCVWYMLLHPKKIVFQSRIAVIRLDTLNEWDPGKHKFRCMKSILIRYSWVSNAHGGYMWINVLFLPGATCLFYFILDISTVFCKVRVTIPSLFKGFSFSEYKERCESQITYSYIYITNK